jgi:hypothetical protein
LHLLLEVIPVHERSEWNGKRGDNENEKESADHREQDQVLVLHQH